MRIVKSEKIYFSQKEADTWYEFEEILNGLERECECPDTKDLIRRIQSLLCNLWEKVEDVE